MATPVFDVVSESTLQADPQTHSHAGAASGVKGLVGLIGHGTTASDIVDGPFTYGGVTVPRIITISWTGTEPGRVYGYFLGTGVLQGTRTVSVGRTEATTAVHLTVATVTATADLEVVDSDSLQGDVTDPSLVMSSFGRAILSFAGLYTRINSPSSIAEGTGTTLLSDWDFDDAPTAGSFSHETSRQTAGGTSDFTHGFTAAGGTGFEKAMIAFAIAEVISASASPRVNSARRLKSRVGGAIVR